ncbi:hypothetical protein [Delftia sp. PS-11]|uniref:hypothetical protein n=1 Tax=Delftia sp. PS-11 TaxID=2767222 RepID=UPI002456109A|nr:hypothetical protein [Delftia sp. PS-11]KAJ8743676.1 hypothetical protein H9T68_15880 [Delftia sp. PS-11]
MNLTEGERAYLIEMRALSTDAAGNEVFAGLTVEESKEFHRLSIRRDSTSYEEGDRYIQLSDKHETARIQVIAAEAAKRHSGTATH